MPRRALRALARFRDAAPIISVALLLILPIMLPDGSAVSAMALARNERIQAAIDSIPWKIGRWRGELVPIPAAATEILRPNAVLSRQYRELGTDIEATLVIVHCSDSRDMYGHWPPNCFPANGWITDGAEIAEIECNIGLAEQFQARCYDFHKTEKRGLRRNVRVYNFFILPDGSITSERSELKGFTSRTATSALGVAQVQIVFFQRVGLEDQKRAVRELLEGIDDVLASLGRQQP